MPDFCLAKPFACLPITQRQGHWRLSYPLVLSTLPRRTSRTKPEQERRQISGPFRIRSPAFTADTGASRLITVSEPLEWGTSHREFSF